jgi:cyclopropane fatty-acyl-phospholipid synthase-like methyltransferase
MDNNLHTVNVYNEHVKDYVNKFMDLDLYRDPFDHLLQLLPAGARILELGCGPGNVVKYLRSKRSDLDISGIDLAPEMIREARKQNPGSKFEVMDIREADQINENFDAVIAAFCLPYLSEKHVPAFFKTCSKLCRSNGLFYLSCMEGPRERSGFEKTSFTGDKEMYISYYKRTEIEVWLKEHKFDIEAFYAKDYHEPDGSVTIDLLYIARKR